MHDGQRIAEMRCVIWNRELLAIQKKFQTAGIEFELRQGIKALLFCKISFMLFTDYPSMPLMQIPAFCLVSWNCASRNCSTSSRRKGQTL